MWPAYPHDNCNSATPPKPRIFAFLLALFLVFDLIFPSPLRATTELTPTTCQAFDHYVQLTEARIQRELADPKRFLYFNSLPEPDKNAMVTQLHTGRIVIEPVRTLDDGHEVDIPNGLVHHWLALGFLPGATLDRVVALGQDYPRHAALYAPDVQQAQILSHDGQHFSVYYRFYRHAIVTAVYNTEFTADYESPDPARGYCFARSVRIAEVQNPGKSSETEFPVGNDHGYMWRLNLYTRYLQSDDGVYIEIEFVALSRTVPRFVAWLVNPYLRSIPRDYLTNYLHATRRALLSGNPSPRTK